MRLPVAVAAPLKRAVRHWASAWPKFSRLFLVQDVGRWVIAQEIRALRRICSEMGITCSHPAWLPHAEEQCVFYGSQFSLLQDDWLTGSHRVATAYFHGRPGTGHPEFDELYDRVRRHHQRIERIQVSHGEMHDLLLETGISPAKVFRIPIGVDIRLFSPTTSAQRLRLRRTLGIPEQAVVVGSFQKDGQGWGEGLEPKLIKGPDVLLKVLGLLKVHVPELFVLLTGPARGFVQRGLNKLGIPHTHVYPKKYAELCRMYQVLDLYLVTSRQEGGPKAVLESMAAGVPLISTRVGQAGDLVLHGQNGWLVDVDDVEQLAYWARWVLEHPDDTQAVLLRARQTALENDYSKQIPLWRKFMQGFVACPS